MKGTRKIAFATLAMLLLSATGLFAQESVPVDAGSTAWMLTSTALVLLMIPGLAMFYGGLVRSKNVLGTMMHSFVAMGVMTVLWVVLGYSMSFGENVLGGFFGWNSDYFLLKGIDETINDGIPEYVFAMFQGKFAIITPALIAGAFAERVKFKGYVVFIVLWGIIVYNPLCHWVWYGGSETDAAGFLFSDGAIDFAGGTVVHISAGVSGLVAALYLGARRNYRAESIRPSNLVMTLIGAGLLWVGWFGFNAGSAVSSSLATAQALAATQVAAGAGMITWLLIEVFHQGKATALGAVSGILAGLVAVTPAAGVVQPFGAMMLGMIASFICYGAILMKNRLGYDDSLDAFGVHGMGGIVGAIFLVFFLRDSVAVDFLSGNADWSVMHQLWIQVKAVLIASGYAVVCTIVILFLVEKTIGLRSSKSEELRGLDDSYHGERGYGMVNPD